VKLSTYLYPPLAVNGIRRVQFMRYGRWNGCGLRIGRRVFSVSRHIWKPGR
jgi:hypothetical protein